MRWTIPLPSENSLRGVYARALARLIGPALQALPGSIVEADYLGRGAAFAAAELAASDAFNENFPDSAVYLLAVLERVFGLAAVPSMPVAERQRRLLAAVRARRAGTAQNILGAVQRIEPDASLHTVLTTAVPQVGNPDALDRGPPSYPVPRAGAQRGVYRFSIRIPVARWKRVGDRLQIRAIAERMKPAMTQVAVHTNDPAIGFLCDDPNSLVDRDVLGH